MILQLWEGTLKRNINQKRKRNHSLVKYILPTNQNNLTMRCKKCGFIKKNNITKVMCWREWQLCSICAVEEHPDKYSYNQQRARLSMRYNWAKSQRPYNIRKKDGSDLIGI